MKALKAILALSFFEALRVMEVVQMLKKSGSRWARGLTNMGKWQSFGAQLIQFLQGNCATYSLVLSWREIDLFLSSNTWHIRSNFHCISSYFSVWYRKLWWIRPTANHQTITTFHQCYDPVKKGVVIFVQKKGQWIFQTAFNCVTSFFFGLIWGIHVELFCTRPNGCPWIEIHHTFSWSLSITIKQLL